MTGILIRLIQIGRGYVERLHSGFHPPGRVVNLFTCLDATSIIFDEIIGS